MTAVELRAGLHHFIDQIEDIGLLKDYYKEMKKALTHDEQDVWKKMTEKQKMEVLSSYEESEEDENLLDHDEVVKGIKHWPSK